MERVVEQAVLLEEQAVRPEEPRVVQPGEPQVVRPEEPQAVLLEELQAVLLEELQVLPVQVLLEQRPLEELQEPSVRWREL